MAITTVGFDGSVSEAQWAHLMRYQAEIAYRHGVASGLDVTAAGARTVSVSAGTAVLPGLVVDSNAAVTLTHAANSASTTRVDVVALQSDWTANAVSLVVVQGAASAPTLTQTEGGVWQMPLARVFVRASVTTILSSDIIICKPLPRTQAIVYTPSVSSSGAIGPNASPQTLASASVTDPGWPYRLRIAAAARFGQASGFGFIDVVSGSLTLAQGISGSLSSGRDVASAVGTSDVLTGARTVSLRMSANGMNSGDQLSLFGGGTNSFTVEVVPA